MKTFLFLFFLIFLISCHTQPPEKTIKKSVPKPPPKPEIHLDLKQGVDLINHALSVQKSYQKLRNSSNNIMLKGIRSAMVPEGLTTVTLIAAGDIIPHGKVKQTALTKKHTQKNPDFNFPFKEVASLIKDADIAFANLETPIRPDREQWRSIPFKFNTPVALVKTLKTLGFDLLNLANNHLYDQGVKGVSTTIDQLNKLKIPFIGIGKNYSEAIKPVIIKKKGITFGFLGFTTLINNDLNQYTKYQTGKKGKPFVNRLHTPLAVKMVKQLKKKVDVVIVSVHWGIEYHKAPSIHQKRYTKALFKAGASVILGHHPHVLQPVIYQNNQLVVYSLGNFLSNQFFPLRYRAARHREANREGMFLKLSFSPETDGSISISNREVIPTYIKKIPREKKGDYRIKISALQGRKDRPIREGIISFMIHSSLEQFLEQYPPAQKQKKSH